MSKPIRIEQWAVIGRSYGAPETGRGRLSGHVYGDPRAARDGVYVETTAIVSAVGRLVTTQSGTVYELGEPDSLYCAWLARNGYAFNTVQPITFKKPGA